MNLKHEIEPLAYSIPEACHLLSLGQTKIYSLINEGRLKRIRVGGRALITASSVKALVEGGS